MTSHRRSGQREQNVKSKPRNNTSAGVRSSAAPQSELSSTSAVTESRHLSATESQYAVTNRPEAGLSKHLPTSATSHEGRTLNRTGSSLRESSTRHRHATHQCHTILQIHRQLRPLSVTLRRMTKTEEIRARALMPSNSKRCRNEASFPYRWTPTETSKLLWKTRDARKHTATLKILVGGNNNTWITFSALAYAQGVKGYSRRDELSTR
jgi:hypothetical protein